MDFYTLLSSLAGVPRFFETSTVAGLGGKSNQETRLALYTCWVSSVSKT